MGCGASTTYSKISPELEVDSNDALFSSEAPEVDAVAWQAGALTKPPLARDTTHAHSPKEALALDLFLLSANLIISKNVSLLPTQNIFNEVLVSYSIRDHKELEARDAGGRSETYLEQRRELVASLYREVELRLERGAVVTSADSGSTGGIVRRANHGAVSISPPSKSHGNITRGFLTSVSNLFGGHGHGHGHANSSSAHRDPVRVFSPQEGAGVLQAGQVLIDLLRGYHTQRSNNIDGAQEPLAVGEVVDEWDSPSSKYGSPRSKYGSPSGKEGSLSGSPSAKSQHSKVAAFALSSEKTLLISDIYLGQLRAILLQYFQSLTSPALSQKQTSALSPMSLALSALRQTDMLLGFIHTIAVGSNGGFGILLMPATSRSLWIQCTGHVCGTVNLLCNFYMHHFLNTGPEHKYRIINTRC